MMLIQCAKRVTCSLDGKAKTFYFTAIRADGLMRPGLRHGCNDRTARVECIDCWRRVRADVFKQK